MNAGQISTNKTFNTLTHSHTHTLP